MLHRFRDRFGTAGVVIAVIALVAALGGTAFAASGALTGKQKKEVEKIAKKFQGTGPAGAQGPAGTAGAKGDTGNTGTPGINGTSVVNTTEPTETGNCGGRGGSKLVGTSTTFACNGEKGQTGFVEKVPSGSTLTGLWSASGGLGNESTALRSMVTISFPFEVSPAPTLYYMFENLAFAFRITPAGEFTLFGSGLTEEEVEAACPGTPTSPEATAGNFCVYAQKEAGASLSFANDGALIAEISIPTSLGLQLPFRTLATRGYAIGSWAVTAE